MIDLSIAIAWIAISVVGMKGLSALTRAVALDNFQAELHARRGTELHARRGDVPLQGESFPSPIGSHLSLGYHLP
jgi:hypothetical protein